MKNTTITLRTTRRNALVTVNAAKALYLTMQARLRHLRKMFPLYRLGNRPLPCGCCTTMVVSRNMTPAQQEHYNLVRKTTLEAREAYITARHTYFMLSQLPG